MRLASLLLRDNLPDHAYVELVRSVFIMLLPSVVMSLLFVLVAIVAVWTTGDPALGVMGLLGAVASAIRLAVVAGVRRRGIAAQIADRVSAGRCELRFGLTYVCFAAILGLFAARLMTQPPVKLHLIAVALVTGYAAGAAAAVSMRPRIAGTSMVLAVMPCALVCAAGWNVLDGTLATVLAALLGGGLQNMRARVDAEVEKIELRRAVSGLARRDHLTGLMNRLGLAEGFEAAVAACSPGDLVAVHCLDLDRFKAVNDTHGHPVGDALLRAVAGRLAAALRQEDAAARVGGDEFVVLQRGARNPDEAHRLADRLTELLSEPYRIDGRDLTIGVSIGFAVSRGAETLDALLLRADNALYAVKALGGGPVAHGDRRPAGGAFIPRVFPPGTAGDLMTAGRGRPRRDAGRT